MSKHRRIAFLNATRIQIVGALLFTVLSVPSLRGQQSRSDPWIDFPSYDQTLVWYLRREDGARLAREMLSIDQWLDGREARQQWPERLQQFVRDYDGTDQLRRRHGDQLVTPSIRLVSIVAR